MRLHFVTFANRGHSRSLARIQSQAHAMSAFDSIVTADERHLSDAFRSQFKSALRPSVRGFGYWCWKPQIVLQTLGSASPNDVVLYADAGCHFNLGGRNRLFEYVDAVMEPSGILAFSLDPVHSNRRWSKADLFHAFGLTVNHDVARLPQVAAGIFVLRKTPLVIQLIHDWRQTFVNDWHLIDDSPSLSPNHESFEGHRHDQSIFSLLVRERGALIWDHGEHYQDFSESNSGGPSEPVSPVLALRDLEKSRVLRARHALGAFMAGRRGGRPQIRL
jgi:hypothetical protein